MLYNILRFLAFVLAKIVFWVRVEGKEYIPKSGPLIIASNHLSNLDPIILGAVFPRRVSFLAKQELFASPIFAYLLKKLEAFPVRRGRADIGAMKEASRRLKRGGALILFPQGRRSTELDAGGLLSGVGFLARTTQARVLPARIFGTEKAMPPGAFLPRPAKVRVKFASPLQFSPHSRREEIVREIFKSIKNIG